MAALFFDVDGTLIDSFHGMGSISPAVRAELARVQAQGHQIYLSSGRSRLILTPELLGVGFDGLVLINGGNVVLGGSSVHEERMGTELAAATADFLECQGYEYLIVCAEHTYTRPENQQVRDFFRSHGEIFTFDYDLDAALAEAIKLEAMVPVEDRAHVSAEAAAILGPAITCDGHGGEGTFELYPTAISKARGIEVVLERTGIDRAETYAFGDGANDLEMLRFCACGVAMDNAEEAVKAEADLICPPVWEDGLAHVLSELF